ncbi:MAG: hypothetical protein E6G32_09645 [Actinobacteria bacterium]|nr:MAG: hypothetical protein E6G32_09645 [Actinomycetota bacterium]
MNGRGLSPFLCALGATALLAVTGASARDTQKRDTDCTWGASSVTATLVDGKLVESQPQTSGCIPNP